MTNGGWRIRRVGVPDAVSDRLIDLLVDLLVDLLTEFVRFVIGNGSDGVDARGGVCLQVCV